MPDSCQVKNPKNEIASYKSTTDRSIQLIGSSNPGVGAYNVNEFKAFGHQKLEGGGAPNNFTMCYKDINPCIRKVDTIPSPRLTNPEHRTPHEIGPGSYLHDKGDINFGFDKFKKPVAPTNPNMWGKVDRFKQAAIGKNKTPGPGEYKDFSKWNKRTYNLKFLNNQTNASQSQIHTGVNNSPSPGASPMGRPDGPLHDGSQSINIQ